MSKHTPGPWEWGQDAGRRDAGFRALGNKERLVVLHNAVWKVRAPNAHLIAAAPDLLEALEALVITLREAWASGALPAAVVPTEMAQQANAAILKAKGETP